LQNTIARLGGTVITDESDYDFNTSVTHVVAPPNARTPKVTIAALMHKWILTPDWVTACEKQSKFVDEKAYGVKSWRDPFNGVLVYLTPEFKNDQSKFRVPKVTFCKAFIETYGKGKLTEDKEEAKYWIIGNNEQIDEEE
jgi:hypothetical protein